MYNYKLVIEYDGSKFLGWQRQKNAERTIQGQLEACSGKILREKISITGAGRTDAGVSAYNQVANFRYHKKIDLKKFSYSLNSILPSEITLKKISLAGENFNARYSAVKRQYLYKITTVKKSIGSIFHYKINYKPDLDKIDIFFRFLLKQKSFRSFCKNKSDKHNFHCRIFEIKFNEHKSKSEIIFSITADRFLHSMVRAILGCALEIGRSKISLKEVKQKFKNGEKINIHYLPPYALFLNKIYY